MRTLYLRLPLVAGASLAALCFLLVAAPAHADLPGDPYDKLRDAATSKGRIEVRGGAQSIVSTNADFADEAPTMALTFGAGYFIANQIVLGIGGSFGVFDRTGDTYEAYASATAHRRVPLVRLFATARAGYYRTEVRGSDYVFSDRGPRLALDLGFRLAVPRKPNADLFAEPAVMISFVGSSSIHDERNSSYPSWTGAMILGVAVPVTF